MWQIEHAESILGVAFIVTQTYILGTVEDLNKIRESNGKNPLGKVDIYSDAPQRLSNNVSSVLLINSIANYYKHHDDCDVWPTNLTGEILNNVGIGKDTKFPCYVAATKLWDKNDVGNLKSLLKIISDWREYVLAKYK